MDKPIQPRPMEALGGVILENLLDDLKVFIEEDLKDYRLPVKQGERKDQPLERPVEVSSMVMPDPDDDHERVPYIMLQLLNGKDERADSGQMKSQVNVRIVITIFNRDKQEGRLQILHIIQKLRADLLRKGIVGRSFEVLWPLEYLIYPDETEWNHLGEMSVMFSVPPVEREVPFLKGGWDAF